MEKEVSLMPVIIVEGGKIDDPEKKRKLISKLTDAACEAYGTIPKQAFVVIIKENSAENIGSGGECLADRMKK